MALAVMSTVPRKVKMPPPEPFEKLRVMEVAVMVANRSRRGGSSNSGPIVRAPPPKAATLLSMVLCVMVSVAP